MTAAIGTAYVEVLPDARRFADDLRAKLANLPTPKVGIDTTQADAGVARLKQKVASVAGRARVEVETTGAGAKLDELKAKLDELSRKRFSLRVDAAGADAKLAALGAEAKRLQDRLKAKVEVDTEAAKARLRDVTAEMTRIKDVRATVRVDTAGASAKIAALRAELDAARHAAADVPVPVPVTTSGSGRLFQGFSGGGADMGGLAAAGVSLGSALIPVAGAATELLAGIGAAATGAAAGVGVLKLAFSGVGAAIQALGAQSNQSIQQIAQNTAQQLASADSVINAQQAVGNAAQAVAFTQQQASAQAIASSEAVANAQQAVGNAARNAAISLSNANNSVQNAEQGLASAQWGAYQAQTALTQARRAAAYAVQDLNNQIVDGQLAQRQATLQLQQASYALATVQAPLAPSWMAGIAGNLTQQQTQATTLLAYDQAKQRLAEIQLNNQRLSAQKTLATRGMSPAQLQLIDANHRVALSVQAIGNAQQNVDRANTALVSAQINGAQSVTRAQQALGDAVRNQALQAASGARAVQQANQGVAASQRALTLAYAQAAAQGNAAQNAVDAAMAKLSPAARAFAMFWNATVAPAIKALQSSAAQGLLPGLQALIQDMMPFLPGFVTFVGEIARTLGNMFAGAGQALGGGFWRQFGDFLAQFANSSLQQLGPIIGNVAVGFAGLFEAIAPLANSGLSVIGQIAQAFASFGMSASGNSGLQAFIRYVQENTPVVLDLLKNLGGIAFKLIIAFAPLGAVLLKVADVIAGLLDKLTPGELLALAGGIAAIIAAVTGPGTALVAAVTGIVAGLVYAYTHFRWFHDMVNAVWHGIETAAMWVWHNVLQPFLGWWGTEWPKLARAFSDFYHGFIQPAWDAFANAVAALYHAYLQPLVDYIKKHWPLIATTISVGWHDFIEPALLGMVGLVVKTLEGFAHLRDGLKGIWYEIQVVFTGAVNFITQNVLNPFFAAINAVTSALGIPAIGMIGAITAPGAPPTGSAGPPIGGAGHSVGGFAAGGVLPGFTPGIDVHRFFSPTAGTLNLSGGEGIIVPEAVKALGGAAGVQALNSTFSNRAPGGGGSYAGGGIFDVIGGILSSAMNTLNGIAATVVDVPMRAAESAATSLIGSMPMGRPLMQQLAAGEFANIVKAIHQFIAGHTPTPSMSGAAAPLGNHLALIKQALGLAGVADTAGNEAAVNLIIKYESGWNPAAINLTDSNAIAGHPSQGLMQTIPSTFMGNRLPSLSANILDPLSNMVAGIRYAVGRYSSLLNVPGVVSVNSGGPYVGYDTGGVLQPGITRAFNGTGRTEAVFTDAQLAVLARTGWNANQGAQSLVGLQVTIDAGSVGTLTGHVTAVADSRIRASKVTDQLVGPASTARKFVS